MDSLSGLQGLYQDLVALSDTSLPNSEQFERRLWEELQRRLPEFRDLLDKAVPDTDPAVSVANGKYGHVH